MPAPNSSWDSVTTVTLENLTNDIADNISKHSAVLTALTKKDRVRMVSGGDVIVERIAYPGNDTYKRYSGWDVLDVRPTQDISAASYTPKQAAVSVAISGREQTMNQGKEKQMDLLEQRIKNAMRALKNGVAGDLLSDGTSDSAKQIDGLLAAIPLDPTTGTYAGINRATYTWWRPYVYDATTDGGSAATSSNIEGYMERVWSEICRGEDAPDAIIADNTYWRLYAAAIRGRQFITTEDTADSGRPKLKFMNADVYMEGYGAEIPDSRMWFLNTDYLSWRPYEGRNFAVLDGSRYSYNQDGFCKIIAFMGNLTTSCAFVQGFLKD